MDVRADVSGSAENRKLVQYKTLEVEKAVALQWNSGGQEKLTSKITSGDWLCDNNSFKQWEALQYILYVVTAIPIETEAPLTAGLGVIFWSCS
jgi:hypothetical protein